MSCLLYDLLTAKIIAVPCAAAFLLLEISEHDVGDVLELLVHLPDGDLKRFQEIDLLILKYFPDTWKIVVQLIVDRSEEKKSPKQL